MAYLWTSIAELMAWISELNLIVVFFAIDVLTAWTAFFNLMHCKRYLRQLMAYALRSDGR